MACIQYVDLRLHKASKLLVERATALVEEYAQHGIKFTLRGLYYKFVGRNWIENTVKSYKNFGHTLSEARKGGYFDWDGLVDQHRPRLMPFHYADLVEKIESSIGHYKLDRWDGQRCHVEVVVEKDTLQAVMAPVCDRFHVTLSVNKGYNSQTAMQELAERLKCYADRERVVVLYFGDHDPSGNDMVRDIRDRLAMYGVTDEVNLEVRKLGITIEQVRQYKCPPNPVWLKPKPGKTRYDARADAYVRQFGRQSWEVDALDPLVQRELLETAIKDYLDQDLFDRVVAREKREFKEYVRWLKKIPTYKRAVAKAKREEKRKLAKERKEKARQRKLEAKRKAKARKAARK